MMAGLFKLHLLSFTIFVLVCLVQPKDIDAQYSTGLPTTDDTALIHQCQHTWQFYNTTSKMCKCGNNIHGAVLCNNTTNSVHLLDCCCMTLSKTDQYRLVNVSLDATIHCHKKITHTVFCIKTSLRLKPLVMWRFE